MTQADSSNVPRPDRRRLLYIVLVIVLLLLLCVVIWLLFFQPPAPELVANPGGPYITNEMQTITFDGSASIGEGIVSYSWDFGDGGTGEGVTTSHMYPDGLKQFTATLTITDDKGATASATTQVTINNLPPTANADGPYTCLVGQTIQLSGQCNDPSAVDQASLMCAWADFNGAALSQPGYVCPNQSGNLTLTLTATDKDGASAQDATTVTVQPTSTPDPTLPTAVIRVPIYNCSKGPCFRLDGSVSRATDGRQLVTYEWNFGDGSSGSGAVVEHTYESLGSYIITLTVTDSAGDQDSSSIEFTFE